jgi:hypothetical protein
VAQPRPGGSITAGAISCQLAAGRYVNLAELPGFTRGLDIFGGLAFVGLSQVRESAVFSGLAIAEKALAAAAFVINW